MPGGWLRLTKPCALLLIATMNANEVAQVFDQLVQAGVHSATLVEHIDSTNLELRSEFEGLAEEEQRLAALDHNSESLRSRIEALR